MTMFGGILSVLEKIKVKNIFVGKQFEENSNYSKFLKIVKSKKIEVKTLCAGQKINLSKSTYIEVLWPDKDSKITQNLINNNALVFKLYNSNMSILFTGDIEEEAEKELVKKYKNKLSAQILKVAHHGSNSSSTREFINLVKPKIALIGVGKDNKYGHPSDETINLLKSINCKIYRTDENGEITIKNGKITTKLT